MELTFEEFIARKYAEAEEYACNVTREQEDIARDAWETAELAVLSRLTKEGKIIAGYEENIIHWRDGFMPSLGTVLYRLPYDLKGLMDDVETYREHRAKVDSDKVAK